MYEYLDVEKNLKINNPCSVIHLHEYMEGNLFVKHRDVYYPNQVLNIGVCLNDDYEGGELMMFGDHRIHLPAGAVVVFPSNFMYPHEVKPVKSGIRYSYVSWTW